ncbi:MAG: alternative ribosome rescue aminoacyl-tRNA hydrolase ArfB [Flavobacteriaceae bacterium]
MDHERILQELKFQAVRSSGPGGQHVNKVSSKVVLSFKLDTSSGLSEKEKELLLQKLNNRLTKEHVLHLHCEQSRSQHKNKELVIKQFFELLDNALKVPKKRKKTQPSKTSVEKRLASKRRDAQKKFNRRKPEMD